MLSWPRLAAWCSWWLQISCSSIVSSKRARSAALGCLDPEIGLRPRRELGRSPAGDLVRERNLIGRLRTEVGVRFPVAEHLGQTGCPRKGTRECRLRDLLVREVVP